MKYWSSEFNAARKKKLSKQGFIVLAVTAGEHSGHGLRRYQSATSTLRESLAVAAKSPDTSSASTLFRRALACRPSRPAVVSRHPQQCRCRLANLLNNIRDRRLRRRTSFLHRHDEIFHDEILRSGVLCPWVPRMFCASGLRRIRLCSGACRRRQLL